MSEKTYREETSELVRSLQVAAARQSEKTYRGSSKDKLAQAKINGNHELLEIQINNDELGLSEEAAQRIADAVLEAVNRSLANSQSAARRALEQGLDGQDS